MDRWSGTGTTRPPGRARRLGRSLPSATCALVAAAIAGNAVRLRARVRSLAVLVAEAARSRPAPPAGMRQRDCDFITVTAADVVLDDATVAAAVRHAEAHELDVVDLVPGDLPVTRLIELATQVDTARYRTNGLAIGWGAGHAAVVRRAVLDRVARGEPSGSVARRDLDPVAYLRLARQLKRYAATSTDLAVAPGPAHGRRPPELATAVPAGAAGSGHAAAGARSGRGRRTGGRRPGGRPPHGRGGAGCLPRRAGNRRRRWPRPAPRPRRRGRVAGAPAHRAAVPAGARRGRRGPPLRRPSGPRGPRRARRPAERAGRAPPGVRGRGGAARAAVRTAAPQLSVVRVSGDRAGTGDARPRPGQARHVPPRPVPRLHPHVPEPAPVAGRPRPLLPRLLRRPAGRAHRAAVLVHRRRLRGSGPHARTGRGRCAQALARRRHRPRALLPDGQGVLARHPLRRAGHDRQHRRGRTPGLGRAGPPRAVPRPGRRPRRHLRRGQPAPLPRAHPRAGARARRRPHGAGGGRAPARRAAAPESALGRWLGWAWGPWFQPQHQHLVPLANLVAALERRGFEIVATERAEAHQPVDLVFAVMLLAMRLAPAGSMPWDPPHSRRRQARRGAVFASLLPLAGAAMVGDQLLRPVVAARPELTNTYRVLARKT